MASVGLVLEEPLQQMEFLSTAASTGGELVACRVRVAPGRPAPPEHVHPKQEERFKVEFGTLGYLRGEEKLRAAPGEVVVIPPGTNHTFWNEGDDELSLVAEVRPALHFEDFAETIHVLIRDGHLSAGGRRPNPLRLAVVASAYRDEWRLTRLSPVARALMPVLAWIGRGMGYRSRYSDAPAV